MYDPMKLLIFSDSHGRGGMEQAAAVERPDHILHLGDCVRDAQGLKNAVDCPVTYVPGNCDYNSSLPEVLTLELGGKRIYMTHGHLHGVKMMYMRAVYAALEAQADILLFGHTHHPECFQQDGLWVMNPGAWGYGRSYGLITLEKGNISCQLRTWNK